MANENPSTETAEPTFDPVEALAALQDVSDILVKALGRVSEHLQFWESLHKAPSIRQLSTVLFRRGPFLCLRSLASIISHSSAATVLNSLSRQVPIPPLQLPVLVQRTWAYFHSLQERVLSILPSLCTSPPDTPPQEKTLAEEISRKQPPGLQLLSQSSVASHQYSSGGVAHKQYAVEFVAERVRLLKILKRRLLTALGTVWESCSVPSHPPLLRFNGDRHHRHVSRDDLPADFLAHEALKRSLEALRSMEGSYALPQEQHGPFSRPSSTHTGTRWRLEPGSLALRFGSDTISDRGLQDETRGEGRRDKTQILDLMQCSSHVSMFVDMLIAHYARPSPLASMWVEAGAVGLGVLLLSSWTAKHRGDFSRWYGIARDAGKKFFSDHVWEPFLAIRDDLFFTFRPQRTSIVDLREVQQTQESLHRMLVAYVAATTGNAPPLPPTDSNGSTSSITEGSSSLSASRVKLMEAMMSSYEKEVSRPLQSLMTGHLAESMLIQVQQMKLYVESALVEMQKILRSNEINFAFLAALPALVLSLAGASLARDWWYTRSKGAEGRGRKAQTARRLLLGKVELLVLQHMEGLRKHGREEEGSMNLLGEMVFLLHQLHRSVRREAQSCGEWESLEHDIYELARPDMSGKSKALLVARVERLYECLSVKPQRLLRAV